jgi:hypothetical protein
VNRFGLSVIYFDAAGTELGFSLPLIIVSIIRRPLRHMMSLIGSEGSDSAPWRPLGVFEAPGSNSNTGSSALVRNPFKLADLATNKACHRFLLVADIHRGRQVGSQSHLTRRGLPAHVCQARACDGVPVTAPRTWPLSAVSLSVPSAPTNAKGASKQKENPQVGTQTISANRELLQLK